MSDAIKEIPISDADKERGLISKKIVADYGDAIRVHETWDLENPDCPFFSWTGELDDRAGKVIHHSYDTPKYLPVRK